MLFAERRYERVFWVEGTECTQHAKAQGFEEQGSSEGPKHEVLRGDRCCTVVEVKGRVRRI